MKIKSLKYQNPAVVIHDVVYKFKDFYCDIPDIEALILCQSSPAEFITEQSRENLYEFNGDSWRNHKKLIWDSVFCYDNGYGKASMAYVEGLSHVCDVRMVNNKQYDEDDYLSPRLVEVLNKPLDKLDAFYVKFNLPTSFGERITERMIGYTMFECDRISPAYVDACNRMERIIVPCQHNKLAFERSGVTKQIQVIPLGVNLDDLPLHELPQDNLWIYGTMGTLTARKGADLLIKAFITGLPENKYPDARLFLKTTRGVGSNWGADIFRDKRIMVNMSSFSPEQLVTEFFDKIDCFVAPTRGEGFSLPIVEAMCEKKPVIATNYSGPADFLSPLFSLPIDYTEVEVPNKGLTAFDPIMYSPGMKWAEPDLEQLIMQMRWTYENREAARELGNKAARFARKEFDNINVAKKLTQYLSYKF